MSYQVSSCHRITHIVCNQTSGSTGKPKGVVHTTGGYLLCAALTVKYVFDVHPDDKFACMADVGWITGHTYVALFPSHLIVPLISVFLQIVTSSTALSPTVSPLPSSNPPLSTPHLLVTGRPSRSTSLLSSTLHPLPFVSSVVSENTTSRIMISLRCVSSVPSVNPSTPRHGTGTMTMLVADNAPLLIPSGRQRLVLS